MRNLRTGGAVVLRLCALRLPPHRMIDRTYLPTHTYHPFYLPRTSCKSEEGHEKTQINIIADSPYPPAGCRYAGWSLHSFCSGRPSSRVRSNPQCWCYPHRPSAVPPRTATCCHGIASSYRARGCCPSRSSSQWDPWRGWFPWPIRRICKRERLNCFRRFRSWWAELPSKFFRTCAIWCRR